MNAPPLAVPLPPMTQASAATSSAPPSAAVALELPLPPFDLPLPRGAAARADLGRMGAPDPAHGQLVCASSTVHRDGTSILIAPVGVVGRVAFATAITLFFGVPILGIPLDMALASLIGERTLHDLPGPVITLLYAIAPIAVFVLVFRFIFARWGKGQPFGHTLFAGSEGAQAVTRYYAKVTRTAARYADAYTVVRRATRVVNTRGWTHDEASLRFLDAAGAELLVLGSITQVPEAPGPDALLVAEVARMSCARRLERAHATWRGGGTLTFPLLEEDRLGPRRILAQGETLTLLDAGASRTFDARAISVRANAGQLEIAPHDPSQAGLSVPFASFGDGDVFLALFG